MYSGFPGLKAQSRSRPFRNRSLGEQLWKMDDPMWTRPPLVVSPHTLRVWALVLSGCTHGHHQSQLWCTMRSMCAPVQVHNAPSTRRLLHQPTCTRQRGERVPLYAAHNRKKTDHSAKVESRRFLLNALINTMQIVPPDHFFLQAVLSYQWFHTYEIGTCGKRFSSTMYQKFLPKIVS